MKNHNEFKIGTVVLKRSMYGIQRGLVITNIFYDVGRLMFSVQCFNSTLTNEYYAFDCEIDHLYYRKDKFNRIIEEK